MTSKNRPLCSFSPDISNPGICQTTDGPNPGNVTWPNASPSSSSSTNIIDANPPESGIPPLTRRELSTTLTATEVPCAVARKAGTTTVGNIATEINNRDPNPTTITPVWQNQCRPQYIDQWIPPSPYRRAHPRRADWQHRSADRAECPPSQPSRPGAGCRC